MSSKSTKPETFTILGINHLGLAAKDPEKARWFFREVLGLPFVGEELVTSQSVNTVMFDAAHARPGVSPAPSRLEMLIPTPEGTGPVAKFLEKRGAGIHHVALGVSNVDAAIAHTKALGVRLIDEVARAGAHATRIAFVHPESTGGFLVEFVEETKS